jgi:hypothetical protein
LFTERNGVGRRPLVEALYVAVRVASFVLVLPFLEQAQRRQDLSLSALQQRFRVPPRCPSLPDPASSLNICWPPMTTSSPLPRSAAVEASLPPAPETTQTGALPQPLAAAGRTG